MKITWDGTGLTLDPEGAPRQAFGMFANLHVACWLHFGTSPCAIRGENREGFVVTGVSTDRELDPAEAEIVTRTLGLTWGG